MKRISYKRHRCPSEIIQFAEWAYFRFTMSLRDVEDLLAYHGMEVSYETIRCWCREFGPQIARRLWRKQPTPTGTWHLDEMSVSIGGKSM